MPSKQPRATFARPCGAAAPRERGSRLTQAGVVRAQAGPAAAADRRAPRDQGKLSGVLTVAMELVFAPNRVELRQSAASRELNGIPASAGRFTGTARVILNESQFGNPRQRRPGLPDHVPGLVCPVPEHGCPGH